MLFALDKFCKEHELLDPLVAIIIGTILNQIVLLLQEFLFRPAVRNLGSHAESLVYVFSIAFLCVLLLHFAWSRQSLKHPPPPPL